MKNFKNKIKVNLAQVARGQPKIMDKKDLLENVIDLNLFCIVPSMNHEEWFALKSGRGPLFFDTSKIIGYPDFMQKLTRYAVEIIKDQNISYSLIVGAPYGGLPLSYFVASALHAPCLALRKDGAKKVGTMATSAEILGIYKKGDKVLIIEDAVSSADSVIGFADRLRDVGLIVTDVLAIVDVGRGATENLKAQNINLHPLFTWKELYNFYKSKKLDTLNPNVRKYLDDMFKE